MSARNAPAPCAPQQTTPAPRAVVSAVVLCYRNADDVDDCLRAVERALAPWPSQVVVVDNASDDGTVDVVRRTHPEVDLVARTDNDGFARGCHVGAGRTSGEWILFVNPDAVVSPDAVSQLLSAAREHPEAGILGGRALHPDGRVDPRSWWGRPTLWSTFCFATGLSALRPGHPVLDPEAPDRWDGSAREVPVVSGAMMLVQRAVWESLGGFDRDLLLYGEDVDLCLRARRAGWRPRVVPSATFVHAVGGSTPGPLRTVLVMRGRASVLRRHLPWGTRRLGAGLLVLGVGLRAMASGARTARREAATDPAGWRAAWTARRRWWHGWQPGEELVQVVADDARAIADGRHLTRSSR
ncbi:MAG TPA: glycosyltransferase family 2 protein [Angustibacter sp.]|nr:glycosyltransferase family 2 protein [Angustibacter sp.]